MIQTNHHSFKYILYLLITVISWGIMYPCSKHAVLSGIDGYYLTLLRYGFGAILVSLVLILVEGKQKYKTEGHGRLLWLLGTVGFAGLNFFTFIGIGYSTAEHATIILALMPMLSIMLSSLIERRLPTLKTCLCTLFAFFGIVLVITNGDIKHIATSNRYIGDLLLLIATMCWVIYTYFANQFITKYHWSPLRITALSSSLGAVSIITITLFATYYQLAKVPSLNAINTSLIDIFVLVSTTLVIITWNAGIKGLGAINGTLFVNLVPVISFIIGIYQGHSIFKMEMIGAIMTIAALILNNLVIRQQPNKT
jgi:drug/metabolite transporter (DMT)-like permease